MLTFKKITVKLFTFLIGMLFAINQTVSAQKTWTKIKEELIFENPPFPESHASTIVENTAGEILVSCFGGTKEGNKDVGIWLSKLQHGKWSKPELMAEGVINDTLRYPCWNPVLFQEKSGKLFLFFKVGASPRNWWGAYRTSNDDGKTWSAVAKLPNGVLGPIKNKPIQLKDGTILSPSSTEHNGWKVHIEKSVDGGKTWQLIPVDPTSYYQAIQPSVLTYGEKKLQLLCRSKQDSIVQVWSDDNGKTWGKLHTVNLLNPSSGIDAVTLKDGTQMLVYNPDKRGGKGNNGRQKLNVAVAKDGSNWKDILVLEDDKPGKSGYAYPAIIQAKDGKVHITYTYNRKNIKYVVLEAK